MSCAASLDAELGAQTRDGFLGGALTIDQPVRGFRSGSDTVFLAASVPARPGERVLELGLGAGVASLCLAWRVPGLAIDGLEVDGALAALATRNFRDNGRGTILTAIVGDVLEPPPALALGQYDHAFANPPFYTQGATPAAADARRARARAGAPNALALWVDLAARAVVPGGSVTILHHATRLDELLAACAQRLGDIRVLPLLPKVDARPKRVLLQARRGAPAGHTVLRGFVLHERDGPFTAEAQAVLRQGAALPLAAAGP